MRALVLAIRKLIALIVALLIPGAPVAPQLIETAEANRDNAVIVTTAPDEEEEYDIVEEPAGEFAAVKTWDISESEDDNVIMAFFDTEDTEGLLNQLAGKITALFTPITAYAAEEEKYADIEVFYEDGTLERGNEYGNGEAAPVDDTVYEAGTVVVFGEGKMQENVYTYFMSPQKYVEIVEPAMEKYYGPVTPYLYGEVLTAERLALITDAVELDQNLEWRIDGVEDGYASWNDEVEADVDFSKMLKYSPTTLIIEDGVTNISDYAFLCCTAISEVIIPESVRTIGVDAFAYCENLTKVQLPATLQRIEYGAFMGCAKLAEVIIPESVNYVGICAFVQLAENSKIKCPNQNVKNLFNADVFTAGVTTVVIAE